MEKNKDKKKTLTISSSFKKKIDTGSLPNKENRKSYSIHSDKKNIYKTPKSLRKIHSPDQSFKNQGKNKKLNRKFVEQQATKTLILSLIHI